MQRYQNEKSKNDEQNKNVPNKLYFLIWFDRWYVMSYRRLKELEIFCEKRFMFLRNQNLITFKYMDVFAFIQNRKTYVKPPFDNLNTLYDHSFITVFSYILFGVSL